MANVAGEERLDAGRAEAADSAIGFREGIGLDDVRPDDGTEDGLSDTHSLFDGEGFGAEIDENHADFSPVSLVDGSGGIDHGDSVSDCETASRAELQFGGGREFEGETGVNQGPCAGL